MSDPRTALVVSSSDAMIDTWETWQAEAREDPRSEWCQVVGEPEGDATFHWVIARR